MGYRYNVSCCKTISQNWTETAIDCYRLGCNCSKCNLHYIYFSNGVFRCKMKETVIELVRKIGKPNLRKRNVVSVEERLYATKKARTA